jgi:hypothetical protein
LNPSSICKSSRFRNSGFFSFFWLRNRIGRREKNLHCKTLNHLQANLYTILFTDWILLQSANELGFCKWRIFSFFQKGKKSFIAKP